MKKKLGFKSCRVCSMFILTLLLIFSQVSIYAVQNAETNYGKKLTTYAKGSVVDASTGQKCAKATITYISKDDNTTGTIQTDKNGDFNIAKLETGYYSWYVVCNGYQKGSYLSYPVISGGNNYLFEISKDQAVSLTFELQAQTEGEPGAPYPCEQIISRTQTGNETASILAAGPPTPNIPASVKVRRSNGTIVKVSMEDYISHVVCREMDPAWSIYNILSDQQKLTALKAQAITARGYATYHFYQNKFHSGYDFCDTTHCQVYDPTYSPTLAIQAANETAKQIPAIVSGSPDNWNIQYIDAVFFASCTGSTKNAKDVWGTSYSYLVSVSCPYDTVVRPTLGLSGHGVGFCQDGAAGYANKTSLIPSEIVMHYFTGTTTVIGQYVEYYP